MNYKKIANDLVAKKFADDGMIAWGKRGRGENFFGTGVEGANSWRYAITKVGDDLAFIPFSRSGIYFKNMYVIEKRKIKSLKVKGIFSTTLEMTTSDGHVRNYRVIRSRKRLKKIISKF